VNYRCIWTFSELLTKFQLIQLCSFAVKPSCTVAPHKHSKSKIRTSWYTLQFSGRSLVCLFVKQELRMGTLSSQSEMVSGSKHTKGGGASARVWGFNPRKCWDDCICKIWQSGYILAEKCFAVPSRMRSYRGGDLGGQGDYPPHIFRWRGGGAFILQCLENFIANCHSERAWEEEKQKIRHQWPIHKLIL